MRRVLVLTWALGTASGVLLGLFGVQLVSSRFATARVSPMSHPEVLRALQAARSVPVATEAEVAAPTPPETAPPTAPPDAAPARPSAGAASAPAPTSPASTLPRPGAAAGSTLEAAGASTSSSTTTTVTTALPPPSSTTSSTKPKSKSKSDSKKSDKPSSTTTTEKKSSTQSTSKSKTKTISTRGGVVTLVWENGKVSARAWPKSGWDMYRPPRDNGPDKISVWFWKKGQPVVNVTAKANGDYEANEFKCDSHWDCDRRAIG